MQDQADKITFPTWRRMREYVEVIHRVGLPDRERFAAYAKFPKWFVSPRWYYRPNWVRLVRELFSGAKRYVLQIVRRSVGEKRASDG